MGAGILGTLSRYFHRGARWCAVAVGFSLPISVAADSVLLVLVLAGFALGGLYRDKWRVLRAHPSAHAALALFAIFLVGCLYGDATPADRIFYLGRYRDLLWIPLFLYLFRDPGLRHQGLYALAASLALVLLWSTLFKIGVIPPLPFTHGDAVNPVVFKYKLTHNLLMAFAAFLFTWLAVEAATRRVRLLWSALAALAVVNVTLLVQGATGYLILGALALYLGYVATGWRGTAAAGVTVLALFGALAFIPGPFQERMLQMDREASTLSTAPADTSSSLGLRLEFYRLTLRIIREHPLAGVGTGGFLKAYAEKARERGSFEVRNPHNEYLLVMAQNGVIGLLLLLYLFWRHWQLAPRLAAPLETHVARGLVLMIAAGCLFNSFLLDHTEGLLFAWLTGLLFAGLDQSRGARA
jgi:O-antigen ligase